jgi:Coenzyme A transferase
MTFLFGNSARIVQSSSSAIRRLASAAANAQKKVKVYPSCAAAVAGIPNGSSLFIGGFGPCGLPQSLVKAVKDSGVKDLRVASNNAG